MSDQARDTDGSGPEAYEAPRIESRAPLDVPLVGFQSPNDVCAAFR